MDLIRGEIVLFVTPKQAFATSHIAFYERPNRPTNQSNQLSRS